MTEVEFETSFVQFMSKYYPQYYVSGQGVVFFNLKILRLTSSVVKNPVRTAQ